MGSSRSRFNTTQALKRFCREKYKEDPSSKTGKPPKNSSPKASFVAWAKKNKIDLSGYKTRPYAGQQLIDSDNEDSGSESESSLKSKDFTEEFDKKRQHAMVAPVKKVLKLQKKEPTLLKEEPVAIKKEPTLVSGKEEPVIAIKLPSTETRAKEGFVLRASTDNLEDEVISTLQQLRCEGLPLAL